MDLLGDLLDAGFMLDDEPGYAEAVKARGQGMAALSDAEWATFTREVRPVLDAYARSGERGGES